MAAKAADTQLQQVAQRLAAGHPLGAAGEALAYCRLPDGRVVVVDSRGHKLVFSAEEAGRAAGEILGGPRRPPVKEAKHERVR